MSPKVREIPLPDDARALSTLARIDYVDACIGEAPGALDRSGEEWARALLEEAPAATRTALVSGWFALGLKHGSIRSREHVLGWPVRRSGPDFALLGADSRLGMSAEVLVKREPQALLVATFMRHDSAAARAVWAPIAPGHRRVVQSLLAQAIRRSAGRPVAAHVS